MAVSGPLLDLPESFYQSRDSPENEADTVPTSSFTLARGRLLSDLEANRGNLRLIIGNRGIGKSTCIAYLERECATKAGDPRRIKHFDAGINLLEYVRAKPEDAVQKFFEDIALLLSDNKTKSIREVISKLPAAKYTHFLFIDNLDRLHRNAQDLEFVQYFFRLADPLFKALEKRIVIVITAAPEWEPFLTKEDLSYLNAGNAIQLKGLHFDEMKAIIGQRLTSLGRRLEHYFTNDFIHALNVAARQNPRVAVQFLESFRQPWQPLKLPLDVHAFRVVIPEKLAEGSLETFRGIAAKDPHISWGANQLHRFFDELERSGIPYTRGVDAVVKAIAKGEIDRKLVPAEDAWAKVTHWEADKQVLNDQVRHAVEKWSKATSLSKDILLVHFGENPFSIATTDVEGYADDYYDGYRQYTDASKAFAESVRLYMEVSTIPVTDFERKDLVLACWGMNENLIFSVLAGVNKVEKSIKEGLKRHSDFKEASQRVLNLLDDVFVHLGIHNVHRGELTGLREQAWDAKDKPASLVHWEDYQLTNTRQNALKTYEGLLRLLKPKKVRESYTKDDEIVAKYMQKGESGELEFKSSLLYDTEKKNRNEELAFEVLRAITAYANNEGGQVVIGISPQNEVLGLENDYLLLKGNKDHFEREVTSYAQKFLGLSQLVGIVSYKFLSVRLKEICEITIGRANNPVLLRDLKKDAIFYVRMGNSTRKLDGQERSDYYARRFPGQKP